MRASKPLLPHVVGERRAHVHEQCADIARRYAVARGDGIEGASAARKVCVKVGRNGAEASKPHPASFGQFTGVAGCAKRQRDQIMQMVFNGEAKTWRRERLLVVQDADVVFKKSKGLVVFWDDADKRFF